jgi:hypothetical protein
MEFAETVRKRAKISFKNCWNDTDNSDVKNLQDVLMYCMTLKKISLRKVVFYL